MVPGSRSQPRGAIPFHRRCLPHLLSHASATLGLLCLLASRPAVGAPAPAWHTEGGQPGSHYGSSVSAAGDVNGDGYGDVLVGAPEHDQGHVDEGVAFLFLGSPGGPSTLPAWSQEGNQPGAQFGFNVAPAGDVNGDGYDDALVGAPGYADGQVEEGAVFLYLGSAGGLSVAPARVWQGGQAGDRFGSSVGSAGDVNADGLDDVLVGAPGFDGGEIDEGAAYLFLGSSSELPSAPAWSIEGNQAHSRLGTSVAALGDLNGDGFGDVAIGAPFHDGGQVDEGQVRLIGGTASGLGASPLQNVEANNANARFGVSVAGGGDLTGTGIPRLLIGAPIYTYTHIEEGGTFLGGLGQPVFFLDFGRQDFAHRGVSIASAGDVNADGLMDVVIGADLYDNGEVDEGLVTLHLGHPSFVVDRSPAWTVDIDQPSSGFGSSVASAGDVNGDGFGDVIAGAPRYDHGEVDEGGAFLFLGPSGLVVGVHEEPAPSDSTLPAPRLSARPNPFTESSSLSFELSQPGRVRLEVFDPAGRLVERLVDRSMPAGRKEVVWRLRAKQRVASGIYFARLQVDEKTFVRRLLRVE